MNKYQLFLRFDTFFCVDVCQVLNGMQFVCGMRFNGFLVVGVSGWNMMNGSREVTLWRVSI